MPRSTDVVEVIESYRPLDVDDRVWLVVAPEVRRWVDLAKPPHWRRALHLLQAASKLAMWCYEHDVPVVADTALRPHDGRAVHCYGLDPVHGVDPQHDSFSVDASVPLGMHAQGGESSRCTSTATDASEGTV